MDRMTDKKKRNISSRKSSSVKSDKTIGMGQKRLRRLISVSTSFSSTPQEFEDAMKQMKNKRRLKSRKNTVSEYIMKEEEDFDIELRTIPIKEVVSEDDEQEENKAEKESIEKPRKGSSQ